MKDNNEGMFFFFFFQAEDGIRDVAVTGVQTCALPISPLTQVRVRSRCAWRAAVLLPPGSRSPCDCRTRRPAAPPAPPPVPTPLRGRARETPAGALRAPPSRRPPWGRRGPQLPRRAAPR